MSFLDILKVSLSDNTVLKHEFLLCYNPSEKIVHAFFEGKTDESFYGTFLRTELPELWRLKTYICDNKDGVYYHYEQLKNLHSEIQPLLFFVDKDIEDIIPFQRVQDPKIHVTEFYSVENHVVTSDCIERVWAEIFRQGSGSSVALELTSTFDQALSAAHDIFLDMMAWILFHRREGNRPNLDCIITKELFTINSELVLSRNFNTTELYEYLDLKTKNQTDTDEYSTISTLRNELMGYEPKAVIRGHNEMDFFIAFYKKLKSVVADESDNKIKPQPDITNGNVLDVLGPRTAIPASLKCFLEYHFVHQLVLK
jgi:hypothetical protein